MLPALYFTLLFLCLLYAWLKGAAPERLGASILTLGSILSVALVSAPAGRFGSVETGVLIVDLATSAGFLILALLADRRWPLWVTALQIIGTAGHAVKYVDSATIRITYAFILAFWSYPMLLLIVAGTWRHQQRLIRFGADRSWSSSWLRSGRPPGNGPTG